MMRYKVIVIATLITSLTAHATTDIISTIKEGKEVGCTGIKKTLKSDKTPNYKEHKVDISFNLSTHHFEALEQDSSDLGGYSPIPYPCQYKNSFTSKNFNISNEKVFMCHDDTYGTTEEVYLLKNCVIYGS